MVLKVLLIPLSAGLRFFTVSRLALSPNLIFEIGSSKRILWSVNKKRRQIKSWGHLLECFFNNNFGRLDRFVEFGMPMNVP